MYLELFFMAVFFQVGISTRRQENGGLFDVSRGLNSSNLKKRVLKNNVEVMQTRAINFLTNSVRELREFLESNKVFPRSCNSEWCDPNHEPYPNIVSTMTGYNVLKGNPFPTTQSVDPGFSTGYIFVPTVRTDDGTYALHSGITTRQSLQCNLVSNTETITSANQYIYKILSKSSDGTELGATGYVKTVKVSFDAAFTSSDDYKNNKLFFTTQHGVITLQEATCATYSVRISSFDPPPFSEGFIKSLKKLNSVVDEKANNTERLKVLEDFVEEFGTHFLQHTTMGARTAVTRKYSNQEFKRSTDDQLQKCSDERLKLAIAGNGFGTNSGSCQAIEIAASKNNKIGFNRESLVSYGSRPENNLSEWSRQVFDSPLPIKMGLRPMTDLLTENYMTKHGDIKYEKISIMLDTFYKSYCELKKDSLGIENCEPNKNNICGLNDICDPRTKFCIQNLNKTMSCVPRICIFKNPCQNGASCEDISENDQISYQCFCRFGWEGGNCDVKNNLSDIVNVIFKEIDKSNYKTNDHQYFADMLAADLHSLKGYENYVFVVSSMNQMIDQQAAIGTYFPTYNKYDRIISIGMSKEVVQAPEDFLQVTDEIRDSILYSRATNAQEVVDAVYKTYNQKWKSYPLVFIQAAEKGSGLSSNCKRVIIKPDESNDYRLPCIMVSSYVLDPVNEYDVIVFFGSLMSEKKLKGKKKFTIKTV